MSTYSEYEVKGRGAAQTAGMVSRGKLAARSATTRAALMTAARELFGSQGFAATTVDQVAAEAGVTKGAVYHQFAGKAELFQAVYEELEVDLAQRSVAAAAGGRTGLGRLRRGLDAFLDACLEAPIQRIVLLDGLSVLEWEAWHELGTQYSLAVLQAGLEAAMAAGELRRRPVAPLAHLVQGALIQAGMVLARAEDPVQMRVTLGKEMHALIDGLRT